MPIRDTNVSDIDICPHDPRYRAALDDLPNWQLRILRSGAHLNEPEYNNIEMTHPSWGVYVCDRPGMYLERGRERHEIRRDAISIIPPWLSYTYHFNPHQSTGHAYLHFEVPRLPSALTRSLFQEFYYVDADHCVELMQRWARRFSFDQQDQSLLALEAQNVVSSIFTEFVLQLKDKQQRFLINPQVNWQRLQPALDYIEHDLAKPISVTHLAGLLNCSKEHCIRLFKKILKQTPTQYILNLRVERAADLLLSTSEAIDHIALQCGFPNRQYLSRVFKRQMGVSPAKYRGRSAL